MVEKERLVYLFIGDDPPAKDIKLQRIKEEFLKKESENFNLDVLYGGELSLLSLQEKLLGIPFKSKKRLILIKNAHALKDDVKEFILRYIKSPYPAIVLVLDIAQSNYKDVFVGHICRNAQVSRFKEELHLDTFSLARQIEAKKADSALLALTQLLKDGERPERIMGGLRYAWEKNVSSPSEIKRRLKALLNCDIEIKTGKLRADFALERLVIILCSLPKSFR